MKKNTRKLKVNGRKGGGGHKEEKVSPMRRDKKQVVKRGKHLRIILKNYKGIARWARRTRLFTRERM